VFILIYNAAFVLIFSAAQHLVVESPTVLSKKRTSSTEYGGDGISRCWPLPSSVARLEDLIRRIDQTAGQRCGSS
jgi:hypothetical protein